MATQGSPQGPPGNPFNIRPGQQPTPDQIAAMQRQLAIDAQKNGMTVPEFVAKLKQQQMAMQQAQAQQQAVQQGGQPQQQGQLQQGAAQPITPGPPKPEALAVAQFLKSQDLKPRTCILNGQRKDMFKVKRALRALESPAYTKARKKNPLLPEITDRASLENTFKLLPLSLLALRVSKSDPHEGHDHAPGAHKTKRVKGLWTVKIEQQQECREELHFVWLYEGSQIKQKLYAAGALAVVFAIVMFPLWPMKMRLGVWYLSMGMLGLIGLFFAMAIFRLILFAITMFAVPPGLWLYPNLFEDVGFFDSFRPVWGWQEEKKKGKKKSTKHAGSANAASTMAAMTGQPAPASATTTSTAPQIATSTPQQRNLSPRVEEVFDED
ncbi:translocation protein [Hyaloscypha bicolor E]|uniref:Translocation protein SEC62 n=1 Tax=Hyaloscypha bicolor E TaxID=1095630 RepID=A0A2J6SHT1_9HELO|nr:translocation protein [Hyaloscypha bicolor E]PMD50270.1 translocation protein [Hyaloscypha bicolor E]